MDIKDKILQQCKELNGFKCHCLDCDRGPHGKITPGCNTCYQCWIATGDKIGNTNHNSQHGIALCPTKIKYPVDEHGNVTDKDMECSTFIKRS